MERTDYTIGGESSSQEMCIAFLFYYPAIPLTSVGIGKEGIALGTWMYHAQQAGYMNGTESDIDIIFDEEYPDFSSLSYDGSMDGALEFYNRLYSAQCK